MPCRGQCRWEPLHHCIPSSSSLRSEGARWHHGSLPSHHPAALCLSLSSSEPHGPTSTIERTL